MQNLIKLYTSIFFISLFTLSCKKTPPLANFSFDGTAKNAPISIKFTNTSTDADEYAWDFGDGGTSTEKDPIHTYKNSGTFTITLVAKNKKGDSNIITKPIVVIPAPTVAIVKKLTLNSFSFSSSFDIKMNSLFIGSMGGSTSLPNSYTVSSITITPLTSPVSLNCYHSYYDSFSGMWQNTTYINSTFTLSNYINTNADNPYPSKINVVLTDGGKTINFDLDIVWQ
jgi:PKD repeat protein